jgi:predicted RNA-binding protein (TIGR00451 family)
MLNNPLAKIRSIADYQFGRGVGEVLFPDNVDISYSRRTGRIRHIYLNGKLLATLRPTDGFFSLTIEGTHRLIQIKPSRFWVKIQDEAAPFISKGRSVFAKHVVNCDEEIRPEEEVIVINSQCQVLAVGRAILTGKEMKAFKYGVAVRVRRGVTEGKGKVKREK